MADNAFNRSVVLFIGKSKPVTILKVDSMFQCSVCGARFNDRSNANRHYRQAHLPKTPANCPLCLKTFSSANSRNSHVLSVHGISSKMLGNC